MAAACLDGRVADWYVLSAKYGLVRLVQSCGTGADRPVTISGPSTVETTARLTPAKIREMRIWAGTHGPASLLEDRYVSPVLASVVGDLDPDGLAVLDQARPQQALPVVWNELIAPPFGVKDQNAHGARIFVDTDLSFGENDCSSRICRCGQTQQQQGDERYETTTLDSGQNGMHVSSFPRRSAKSEENRNCTGDHDKRGVEVISLSIPRY
jgi:hypothetical protein